jgi:hypothetical protein
MAENTIKTRIQLKSDTEANWKQAVLTSDNPNGTKTTGSSFRPKQGEAIIFSSDSTHPFSRLKIGDGITDVLSLPFIDSGSTNGFVLKETLTDFPAIGNQNCLYLEASTDTIYEWNNSSGYVIKYGLIRQAITTVSSWDAGTMTNLSLDNNTPTLLIINGTAPTL